MRIRFHADHSDFATKLSSQLPTTLPSAKGWTAIVNWGSDFRAPRVTKAIYLNHPRQVNAARDKEYMLSTLRQNHVPTPRIIQPGSKTDFPILGRSFSHDGGSSLTIVNDLAQAQDLACDLYMSIVDLVREFRVHVFGFTVEDIEEKFPTPNTVETAEVSIRSERLGWAHRLNSDLEPELRSQLISEATTAVYHLGLDFAAVDIGVDATGRIWVLDVNTWGELGNDILVQHYAVQLEGLCRELANWIDHTGERLTIGADPEFLLVTESDGEILVASEVLPKDGPLGCDDRSLEALRLSFPLAEIRPDPSEEPATIVRSIQKIMRDYGAPANFTNVRWLAGAMPVHDFSIGGHIHFGRQPYPWDIRCLDNYLALPLSFAEERAKSRKRKRTRYGRLGYYRKKDEYGGFEYCTPSSWLSSPDLALQVLTLAKLIMQNGPWLQSNWLGQLDVQSAYYRHQLSRHSWIIHDWWDEIQSTTRDSTVLDTLAALYDRLVAGHQRSEMHDIRAEWGIPISSRTYDEGLCVYASEPTRERFSLKVGEPISLGTREIKRHGIVRQPKNDRAISPEQVMLSAELADQLHIPAQSQLLARLDGDRLQLGPILGIFFGPTDPGPKPFERATSHFQLIINLARRKGILSYVFTGADIDLDRHLVHGYWYDDHRWVRRYFPCPDVIYDRAFYNTEEEMNEANLRRDALGVPIINSNAISDLCRDKWALYEALYSNPEIRRFLPETRRYEGIDDYLALAARHEVVFFKYRFGMAAQGVMSIRKTELGYTYVRNLWGRQTENGICKSLEDLERLLVSHSSGLGFIVQQGISLAKYEQRSFELRAVMNKTSSGIWLRTGMVCRLAGYQVPFLSLGMEDDIRPSIALRAIYGRQAEDVLRNVRLLSVLVPPTLESVSGPGGELSVDMGIDTNGHPWVIEANSKPAYLFLNTGAHRLRRMAVYRLLGYSQYLTGFVQPPQTR